MLPNSPSIGGGPSKVWDQSIRSSVVGPGSEADQRRLVDELLVPVLESPDAFGIEVLGNGEPHLRTDRDRALLVRSRRRLSSPSVTVNSTRGGGSVGLMLNATWLPGSSSRVRSAASPAATKPLPPATVMRLKNCSSGAARSWSNGDAVVEAGDEQMGAVLVAGIDVDVDEARWAPRWDLRSALSRGAERDLRAGGGVGVAARLDDGGESSPRVLAAARRADRRG